MLCPTDLDLLVASVQLRSQIFPAKPRFSPTHTSPRPGQLGYAHAIQGLVGDANRDTFGIAWRADLRDSLSTVIARIYIGHGNRDRAFEWLDTPVIDLRRAAEMTPD